MATVQPFLWSFIVEPPVTVPYTSKWIILPSEIGNDLNRIVTYEFIPLDGNGVGRFETTIANPNNIKLENKIPNSQKTVFPFPWAGKGIPATGNVNQATQNKSDPVTAFRIVTVSGQCAFNVRV